MWIFEINTVPQDKPRSFSNKYGISAPFVSGSINYSLPLFLGPNRLFADIVRSYKLYRFPPISELRNEPKRDLNTGPIK